MRPINEGLTIDLLGRSGLLKIIYLNEGLSETQIGFS